MGREAKMVNNLTKKQNVFVGELLKGNSAAKAAQVAYKVKSTKVAASIAHENLNKPDIQEQIRLAFKANGLDITSLTANLKKLAIHEPDKIPADVVLRSNTELLKLAGAYPNQDKHISIDYRARFESMTNEDLVRELSSLSEEIRELNRD